MLMVRPLGKIEAFRGQQAQHRPVEFQEQALPRAATLLKRTLVKLIQQLADGAVQLRQREELAVTQRGQDPPLGDLHADLHLGLIARFSGPRGQHTHAVV